MLQVKIIIIIQSHRNVCSDVMLKNCITRGQMLYGLPFASRDQIRSSQHKLTYENEKNEQLGRS